MVPATCSGCKLKISTERCLMCDTANNFIYNYHYLHDVILYRDITHSWIIKKNCDVTRNVVWKGGCISTPEEILKSDYVTYNWTPSTGSTYVDSDSD